MPSATGQPLPAVISGTHPHGHYSLSEVATIAMAMGFPREEVARAAGIIYAESGGDPHVTSPNPGGGLNVGLAQIQQATAVAYGRSGNVGTLQNPFYNVRTMYVIWNKDGRGTKGYHRWATFQSGAYKKYMDQVPGVFGPHLTGATNSDPFGSGGAVDNAATGVAHAASSIPDFLGHLDVIFQGGFWLRVLQGLGGIALIIMGLVFVSKNTSAGRSVSRGAKSVAKLAAI